MKMRKNAVALSVAALIAGLGLVGGASAAVIVGTTTTAQDLRVNDGGIGHSLLIPYYTAQAGNSTLFNIVNTDTVNGKAVKIRFRGASNSDDVFDFQLFLSPGDVWSANINTGGDVNGLPRLSVTDSSCTLPQKVDGVPFVTTRFPDRFSDAIKAQQTREGYIEIFNMADIHPNTDPKSLFVAIKHVDGAPPNKCSVATGTALGALRSDPANETEANKLGLYVPTTGLFANYGIINQVGAATSWTNEATSILAVNGLPGAPGGNVAGTGNIVFSPQLPTQVGRSATLLGTSDPLLRQGPLLALSFDLPDMSTPYTRLNDTLAIGSSTDDSNGTVFGTNTLAPLRQASDLSMAIATNSVRNEYLTGGGLQAATDWTLSFPTRRYNVALNYDAVPSTPASSPNLTGLVYSDFASAGPGRVNYFDRTNTEFRNDATTGNFPQVCLDFRSDRSAGASTSTLSFYDREERVSDVGSDFVISPGAAGAVLKFCGEVQVLSFNQGNTAASSVLNASVARKDVAATTGVGTSQAPGAPANSGWATIFTPGLGGGLPTLGAYYLKVTNPNNGNFTSNYSGVWNHRYERVVK